MKRKKERRVFADAKAQRLLALAPAAIGADYESLLRDDAPPGALACICIEGPLTQVDTGWFESYECIVDRFVSAINDDAVSGVILKFNSPGGDVAGLFESVMTMTRAKKKAGKPVVAYVDEACYSAAYAMAMVADKIYMPASGGCGSVGVITCMVDVTEANEQAGIRVEVITSGDEKADGHPDVPITDDAIARTQARVDDLAQMFFTLVANSRGMTPASVESLQAGIFQGQDAVDAKLADGIMSWSDFVPAVSALASTKKENRMAANRLAAIKAENERVANLAASGTSAETKFKHTKKTIEHIETNDDPLAKESSSSSSSSEPTSSAPDSSMPPKKKPAADKALLAMVQQMTGKHTPEGIMGALMALQAGKERESSLAARLEKLEAERSQERVAALVDSGVKAGKLAPSQKAWALSQPRGTLKAYLDATPAMVHGYADAHAPIEAAAGRERKASPAMIKMWKDMGFSAKGKPGMTFADCLANMDDETYARLENR